MPGDVFDGSPIFATQGVSPSPSTGLGSEIDSALADVLVNRAARCLTDGRGLFTMAGPLLLAVNPQPSPGAGGASSAAPLPGGPLSAASVFHGNVLWRYYAESEARAGSDAFGSAAASGRGRGRVPPPRPSAATTLPPHVFVRAAPSPRGGPAHTPRPP